MHGNTPNSPTRGPRAPATLSSLALMAAAGLAATAPAAGAVDLPGKAELEQRSLAALPAGWQVRVAAREQALVVYATPPAGQGMQLLYEAERQKELVAKLCPAPSEPVWQHIAPATDIAVAPQFLGKTGIKASCKAVAAAPAS